MNPEQVTPEQARRAGYQAGVAAWRPARPHAVPARPYPGWSDQGREWYLGVVEGLEKAAAAHVCNPETFDGAAYIRANFSRVGVSGCQRPSGADRSAVAVLGGAGAADHTRIP